MNTLCEDAHKHLQKEDAKDVQREIQLVADSLRLGGAILGEIMMNCKILPRLNLFLKW